MTSPSVVPGLASVIVPIWNGMDDLPACMAALLAQTYADTEVIAVDNASTDGSADWLAAAYPQVQLLRNATNTGFGGACNRGLAAARGEWLVLLNQDTVVRPDWLAALVAVLHTQPNVGIVGSKALYPDGTLQHAGGVVDVQGGGRHRGHGETDRGQYDQAADMDYVTGASLALRRAVYAQIGGFDPAFHPAYCEDVDLCLRARAAGWRVVYAPASVLIHNERSRAGGSDLAAMTLSQRHRLRLVCKHWPRARLQQEFLPAEQSWLHGLGPGGEQLIAAVHHAYLEQLLSLGELAAWRQTLLGEPTDAIPALAQVLLTLRTVYPLTAVGQITADALPQPPPLTAVGALATLRATPSAAPRGLWARLTAALHDQVYHRLLARHLTPLLTQQTQFNHALLQALYQTQVALMQTQDALKATQSGLAGDPHAPQRTVTVLLAYLAGQAAEISRLAQVVEAQTRPAPRAEE